MIYWIFPNQFIATSNFPNSTYLFSSIFPCLFIFIIPSTQFFSKIIFSKLLTHLHAVELTAACYSIEAGLQDNRAMTPPHLNYELFII